MTDTSGIRCMLMRGGTSKGAFFLAADLPSDPETRDALLLSVMGSPDPTQIDGLGGGHPLRSKVAIVSSASDNDADVDYLFLQVGVDEPIVSDAQTCGNILAGVGPFAIERGLITPTGDVTSVRVRLLNTGGVATAIVQTPGGHVAYDGDVALAGVPGTASPIELHVAGTDGVLPTGNVMDVIAGHSATIINNGMPVVLLNAAEFALSGDEPPADLESNAVVTARVERIRRAAGPLLGLGDVAEQSVPKMVLLSPPAFGGVIRTRTFIPARVHSSIGVLMAASVAAGVQIPGTVGSQIAAPSDPGSPIAIEHPSGVFEANVEVYQNEDGIWHSSSTSLRTARKIFDGQVFPRPRTA